MKQRTVTMVFLGGLAVACTGPAMNAAGDAMVAVGDAMRDVGSVDVGDVQAEPVTFDVACTSVAGLSERIDADGSGHITTQTRWTADVRATWIDPHRLTHASAIVCDVVSSTDYDPDLPSGVECPVGSTCRNTIPNPRPLDCYSATVEVEDGLARVLCGVDQTTETLNVGGSRRQWTEYVRHGTSARIILEQ